MYDISDIRTPSYVFDTDKFHDRIRKVSEAFSSGINLCYSIKANPFLTGSTPEQIKYLEVCSPGELTICERTLDDLSNIIFSGVNKTEEDVKRAMDDNVGIFTAESIKHVKLINACAQKQNRVVRIILRLTSKNQFGMSESDIISVIRNRDEFKGLDIIGLHYYSGTQKKKAKIIEDELEYLASFMEKLKEEYSFDVSHLEYGPGLACDYFSENSEEIDMALLDDVAPVINDFANRYPLNIEMGRFFASVCGKYYTKIMDIKSTDDTNFVICDGGVHQIKYYGQTMAMQVPHIEVLDPQDDNERDYYLCGSLCTVADVLVRKVTLKGLKEGSVILFDRCGAYSVCEGIALFLSRELPAVYMYSEKTGIRRSRDIVLTDIYNTP